MYGQLFKVQKTGGVDLPADLRTLDSVVIVPWDYDAACQPVNWSQTYHWLREPGVRFFNVELRDRDSWYKGLPTFDAFAPENAAYPPAWNSPVYGAQSPTITPDELFSFYETMPAAGEAGAPGALDAARRWTEAHAAVSNTYPLRWVIILMLGDAATERATAFNPPMVGTYRFTVTLPSGQQRVLYARTLAHPHAVYSEGSRLTDAERALPPSWTHFGMGVELWFFVAPTEDSLVDAWRLSGPEERSIWPWHIAWEPDSSGQWPASIEPFQFFPSHAQAPEMDSVIWHHEKWFDDHWKAHTLPAWYGRFTLGPGNAVRFEEPIPLSTGDTIRVVGDRISLKTVIDSLTPLVRRR